MESDLKTLSRRNLFCKYANDTNFFVPGNSDIGFNEEFINIKNWARANKMIINLSTTIMLIVLLLVSHFNFLFVPCSGLSWLPVSFLFHVKYTLSYRIVKEIVFRRPV